MDIIAGNVGGAYLADESAPERSNDGVGDELARGAATASSPDDAFRVARMVIPHPAPIPEPLRRALFVRSADDLVVKKVLFFAARRDEDVVQDTLAWWWETGIDEFDPSRATVRTYLYAVAFNRLRTMRRTAVRRSAQLAARGEELVNEHVDRVRKVGDPEARALLAEILRDVPEQAATAWLLRAIPNCSNAEIAAVTELPEGSVSREIAGVRALVERRLARRNPALLALLPASMLERERLSERLADIVAHVRSHLRRALATTLGTTASYAVVAGVAAVVAVRAVPPRVQRVLVAPPASAPARAIATPAEVLSAASVPPAAPPPSGVPPARATAPEPPRARVSAGDQRAHDALFQDALANLPEYPRTSLERVAEHRRRWPRSGLALTRDGIEAEALLLTRQRERARAIAQRIVQRAPGSPEARRMRELGLVDGAP